MLQKAVDQLEGGLVIQVKDKGSLKQNGSGGHGEKWLELGPGLGVKATKIANVVDGKGKEKGEGWFLRFWLKPKVYQWWCHLPKEVRIGEGQVLF